jgi:hypothetical protein
MGGSMGFTNGQLKTLGQDIGLAVWLQNGTGTFDCAAIPLGNASNPLRNSNGPRDIT